MDQRATRIEDLVPGETYYSGSWPLVGDGAGDAPADEPVRALSRRKFLAVTGFAALAGLGLTGGVEPRVRDGRDFGRALNGFARPTDLGPRTAEWHPGAQRRSRIADAVGRLVVPAIGLDSGVVGLGQDARGELATPPGPGGVGWYRFSGTPGVSSNVVLAGHVSWHTGEPAAFRRVGELGEGSEVRLTDSLGRSFVYRVFASLDVEPEGDHVKALLGPQSKAICTLISCSGWFDTGRGVYTKRRVVQAAL